MAVDTGATITMIPPEFSMAIGCDPIRAKRKMDMLTASGAEYLTIVTIPLISCLGQNVRSLPVACHDLPPQSTVDGLLGLDFLTHIPAFQEFHRAILRLTAE